MKKLIASALFCLTLTACGDGDLNEIIDEILKTPTPTTIATFTAVPGKPTNTPVPTVTPVPVANPLCTKVMGCSEGFLWKPTSDSTGKLAVHLPKKFTTKFLKCNAFSKKDGKAESLAWGNFGNGDRQLWRAKYGGSNYDGRISCDEMKQTCEWKINKNGGDSSKRCE